MEKKISHCCKASLTVIGFCTRCNKPCDHIIDVELNEAEDLMRQMGINPDDIKF
jgi:uncharacterized metal-binding protein YceD (DUF177 family)